MFENKRNQGQAKRSIAEATSRMGGPPPGKSVIRFKWGYKAPIGVITVIRATIIAPN